MVEPTATALMRRISDSKGFRRWSYILAGADGMLVNPEYSRSVKLRTVKGTAARGRLYEVELVDVVGRRQWVGRSWDKVAVEGVVRAWCMAVGEVELRAAVPSWCEPEPFTTYTQ